MPDALTMVENAAPYLFPGLKNIFLKTKVKDLLFDGVLIDCSAEEADFICGSIGSQAPVIMRQHENKRDYLFSFFHHVCF